MTDVDPAVPSDPLAEAEEKILAAAPIHVTFDGWTRAALEAACRDAGVDQAMIKACFPRGGVDAALAFHRRGDRLMAEAFAAEAHGGWGFTQKVTRAVRLRLEVVSDAREAVRRGAALLSLPIYAPDAARAVWGTADAIWTAVGDASEDGNWYTKRATLSGVYSATALYWLGDETPGASATWEFLDRRISDVMRIESTKAALRRNPLGRLALGMQDGLMKLVKPPRAARRPDAAASPAGH
ncbi:MAG: COQ9 family protein [Pseudomonadota bacterium]